MDIFPVGWCEANAYPLNPPFKPAGTSPVESDAPFALPLFLNERVGPQPPKTPFPVPATVDKQRKIAVVQPEKQ